MSLPLWCSLHPSPPWFRQGTANKAAEYKPHPKILLSVGNTPETTRHHTDVGSHCALSSARHSIFTSTRVWIHQISSQNPDCRPALPLTTGWPSLGFVHETTASSQDTFATYSFPYPTQLSNFNYFPQPPWGYWESGHNGCDGQQDTHLFLIFRNSVQWLCISPGITFLRLCDSWTVAELVSCLWRKQSLFDLKCGAMLFHWSC